MKNLKNVITAISFLFTMFIGINVDAQYSNSSMVEKSSKEFNKYERILTDKEIIQYGIDHNRNLTRLMAENPKSLEDVSRVALDLYKEKGLTNKLVQKHIANTEFMNTQFLTSLIKKNEESFVDSEMLIKKISELNTIIDIKGLKNHEDRTRKVLKGVDLDTYLTISIVSQYSLDFWSTKYPDATSNQKSGWKEADGISAGIGFLTIAAVFTVVSAVGLASGGTGVIPTLTILGSLLGIGISSALASLVSLIN
jgi:hypothetical protein